MGKSRSSRNHPPKQPISPLANELFDATHLLIDRILKGHFKCVAGIKTEQPADYPIPLGEVQDYDFVLRASGPRTRGRPKVISMDITRRATKNARILAITADSSAERRDLRLVVGTEVPVFSFFQGFIDQHGLPADTSIIPNVPLFIEGLGAVVKKVIGNLQAWHDARLEPAMSLQERQQIVNRLLDF